MKNDPVISYNHMEEKDEEMSAMRDASRSNVPISLYMLVVADAILLSVIVFFTIKIIF